MGSLTYLTLNLVFMAVVILLFRIPLRLKKPMVVTAIVLLVLTAVFDSLLVSSGVVGYSESKILGLYIISAPVEDFMYTLLAVLLIPRLWKIFDKKKDTDASTL